jgi:uncharacterized membrane protein YhhN
LYKLKDNFNIAFWVLLFGLASIGLHQADYWHFTVIIFSLGLIFSAIAYSLRSRHRRQFIFNLVISFFVGFLYIAISYPSVSGPSREQWTLALVVMWVIAVVPLSLVILLRRKPN